MSYHNNSDYGKMAQETEKKDLWKRVSSKLKLPTKTVPISGTSTGPNRMSALSERLGRINVREFINKHRPKSKSKSAGPSERKLSSSETNSYEETSSSVEEKHRERRLSFKNTRDQLTRSLSNVGNSFNKAKTMTSEKLTGTISKLNFKRNRVNSNEIIRGGDESSWMDPAKLKKKHNSTSLQGNLNANGGTGYYPYSRRINSFSASWGSDSSLVGNNAANVWISRVDDSTGRMYYTNAATGTKLWTKPYGKGTAIIDSNAIENSLNLSKLNGKNGLTRRDSTDRYASYGTGVNGTYFQNRQYIATPPSSPPPPFPPQSRNSSNNPIINIDSNSSMNLDYQFEGKKLQQLSPGSTANLSNLNAKRGVSNNFSGDTSTSVPKGDAELFELLKSCNLESKYETLCAEDLDISNIAYVTENNLIDLGFKLGERIKLKKAIEEHLGASSQQLRRSGGSKGKSQLNGFKQESLLVSPMKRRSSTVSNDDYFDRVPIAFQGKLRSDSGDSYTSDSGDDEIYFKNLYKNNGRGDTDSDDRLEKGNIASPNPNGFTRIISESQPNAVINTSSTSSDESQNASSKHLDSTVSTIAALTSFVEKLMAAKNLSTTLSQQPDQSSNSQKMDAVSAEFRIENEKRREELLKKEEELKNEKEAIRRKKIELLALKESQVSTSGSGSTSSQLLSPQVSSSLDDSKTSAGNTFDLNGYDPKTACEFSFLNDENTTILTNDTTDFKFLIDDENSSKVSFEISSSFSSDDHTQFFRLQESSTTLNFPERGNLHSMQVALFANAISDKIPGSDIQGLETYETSVLPSLPSSATTYELFSLEQLPYNNLLSEDILKLQEEILHRETELEVQLNFMNQTYYPSDLEEEIDQLKNVSSFPNPTSLYPLESLDDDTEHLPHVFDSRLSDPESIQSEQIPSGSLPNNRVAHGSVRNLVDAIESRKQSPASMLDKANACASCFNSKPTGVHSQDVMVKRDSSLDGTVSTYVRNLPYAIGVPFGNPLTPNDVSFAADNNCEENKIKNRNVNTEENTVDVEVTYEPLPSKTLNGEHVANKFKNQCLEPSCEDTSLTGSISSTIQGLVSQRENIRIAPNGDKVTECSTGTGSSSTVDSEYSERESEADQVLDDSSSSLEDLDQREEATETDDDVDIVIDTQDFEVDEDRVNSLDDLVRMYMYGDTAEEDADDLSSEKTPTELSESENGEEEEDQGYYDQEEDEELDEEEIEEREEVDEQEIEEGEEDVDEEEDADDDDDGDSVQNLAIPHYKANNHFNPIPLKGKTGYYEYQGEVDCRVEEAYDEQDNY